MNKQLKLSLFFALIFLFGAFFAAALRFSYGLSPPDPFTDTASASPSFSAYVLLSSRFLRAELLMLLSAFTIYACAVSALCALGIGVLFGHLVMSYCLSGLNPFTHAAALLFLLAFGSFITVFSANTALFRSTLTSVAPDPKEILHLPQTPLFFTLFLRIAAATIMTSAAFYLFLIYFPILIS